MMTSLEFFKLLKLEKIYISYVFLYFLTRFSNRKPVIKMTNVSRWVVGGGVGQVSIIGFRSITPKPFEIFE